MIFNPDFDCPATGPVWLERRFEMIAKGNKTTWSKATLFNRPGAKKGCDGCGKKFLSKEQFAVCETKVNWFRGDDEVEFLCISCIPKPIRKILKLGT